MVLAVADSTVTVALTPQTLVGRVVTTLVPRNISYGDTSALPARAAAWAASAAALPGVASSPSTPSTPHIVQMLVNKTTLLNFTDASTGEATLRFAPVGRVPELLGVAYPPCSGVTFRAGAQRTHGKKTGLNQLGLITSNNITDTFSGLRDQAWNPLAQFIYDVASAWCAVLHARACPGAPVSLKAGGKTLC